MSYVEKRTLLSKILRVMTTVITEDLLVAISPSTKLRGNNTEARGYPAMPKSKEAVLLQLFGYRNKQTSLTWVSPTSILMQLCFSC